MSDPKRIKLDHSDSTMHPILPDELTEETPLTQVYVDKIKDQKTISKVVVALNSCLPMNELAHLKRIKSKEVLLFPVDVVTKELVHEYLKTKGFDVSLLCNEVRTISVAKIAPKTRKQYTTVQQLWPCNFHSDKYIEKLSTNTLFKDIEILEHKKYMYVAIFTAKAAQRTSFSHHHQGVVIVDPKIKSVVALGYSETHLNPIKHALMIAIDNVAKTQNGGAWSLPSSQQTNSILNLCGIDQEFLLELRQTFPDTTFGASWFKKKDDLLEPSDGPYLCTNYYAYSIYEPCVMCAMALAHSRIKRVFYGMKSSNGGLGSLCKIHTVKDLNHHYEVFAGLCEIECRNLNI